MKNARVLIVLLLVLAFLVACAHTTETAVSSTLSPSLKHILKRGELVVGTAAEMPPLMMKTRDGEIVGFEADIARQMANAMGVKIMFNVMEFSKLLSALEQGKVDMILSYMTITPKRNLKVAFVGPYFISGKGFLTKSENIASAKETTEVNSPSIKLAALRGSTSQYFIEQVLPKVQLVPTKDYDEAVQMVIQDKVDAFMADYPICIVSVFRHPGKGLLSVVTPLTYEPLGIAVSANDPHLINWIENFLDSLEGSGQLEEMRDHWFGDTSWIMQLP